MLSFHVLIHQFFIKSWWVITFIFICAILYEQGLKEREHLYKQLTEQLSQLQQEKQHALQQQQNLQRQIDSQSDIAWIELTLMKGLGLVPEGQQKVYFNPS
jgi:cell division protein FtsL